MKSLLKGLLFTMMVVAIASQDRRPPDCEEVQKASATPLVNGAYIIQPLGLSEPMNAYCDFFTDGGSWTVIQRRVDNSVDFNRTWADYKEGFGKLVANFWMGNDKISALTRQRGYELRIELLGPTGPPSYAKYDYFQVADEDDFYQLILGRYSGTAGADSLDYHRDMYFTTIDEDHDQHGGNCAEMYGLGGWWYKTCYTANLNAVYPMQWDDLPGGDRPLKFTEMKVRAKK